MSRSVWGAIAGLGQGAQQIGAFMFEDIKQQKLQEYQDKRDSRQMQHDKEMAKDQRDFTASENAANREQQQRNADRTTALQTAQLAESVNQNQRVYDLQVDELEFNKGRQERADDRADNQLAIQEAQFIKTMENLQLQIDSGKIALDQAKLIDGIKNEIKNASPEERGKMFETLMYLQGESPYKFSTLQGVDPETGLAVQNLIRQNLATGSWDVIDNPGSLPSLEVGQIYPDAEGNRAEYLGGDPNDPASWREIQTNPPSGGQMGRDNEVDNNTEVDSSRLTPDQQSQPANPAQAMSTTTTRDVRSEERQRQVQQRAREIYMTLVTPGAPFDSAANARAMRMAEEEFARRDNEQNRALNSMSDRLQREFGIAGQMMTAGEP